MWGHTGFATSSPVTCSPTAPGRQRSQVLYHQREFARPIDHTYGSDLLTIVLVSIDSFVCRSSTSHLAQHEPPSGLPPEHAPCPAVTGKQRVMPRLRPARSRRTERVATSERNQRHGEPGPLEIRETAFKGGSRSQYVTKTKSRADARGTVT